LLSNKFRFAFTPNHTYKSGHPAPYTKGRFAIVTDVGRGAVDAKARGGRNALDADGEAVWS
jgi:hypothetical protein